MRNASKYERDFDENKYVFFDKKCRIAKKIEQVWDKNQQYYQKKDLIVDVFTMKSI